MSRIGKKPVAVPKGVTLDLQGNTVAVKGPRGELYVHVIDLHDGSVAGHRGKREMNHEECDRHPPQPWPHRP